MLKVGMITIGIQLHFLAFLKQKTPAFSQKNIKTKGNCKAFLDLKFSPPFQEMVKMMANCRLSLPFSNQKFE
jgi:hypothetical protein